MFGIVLSANVELFFGQLIAPLLIGLQGFVFCDLIHCVLTKFNLVSIMEDKIKSILWGMNMKSFLKISFIVLVYLGLQGCASVSSHLSAVPPSQKSVSPEKGKALVIFMRPSNYGGAIQATVFDDTKYIATVSAGTHVAYQAEPGKHTFMVVSEAADFMGADLKAGKTYYSLVQARMGFWRARFSLAAVNLNVTATQIAEWLDETKRMEPNAEGLQWAAANHSDIQTKKTEYMKKWLSKPASERPMLLRNSGR